MLRLLVILLLLDEEEEEDDEDEEECEDDPEDANPLLFESDLRETNKSFCSFSRNQIQNIPFHILTNRYS